MKKPRWVDRFLSLSPLARSKMVLGPRGLPKRRMSTYVKRSNWNDATILQFVKDHHVLTLGKMRKLKKDGVVVPSRRQIAKHFGKWSTLRTEAFGANTRILRTDEDILSLLVKFKVFDAKRYNLIRKTNKDMLPSMPSLLERFGKWNNVKRLVLGCTIESVIERYMKLKMEIGHHPSLSECSEAGVEMDLLLVFMSRQELINLVSRMENVYENPE